MPSHSLNEMLEFSQRLAHMHVDDVSHEESLIQPQPAGNCLNWVLGHIIATRSAELKNLGAEPFWTPEKSAPYLRGSEGIKKDAPGVIPFAGLILDLDRSHALLSGRYKVITDGELAVPLKEATVRERLVSLRMHEGYHVGQISLLRRLIGKPSMIK